MSNIDDVQHLLKYGWLPAYAVQVLAQTTVDLDGHVADVPVTAIFVLENRFIDISRFKKKRGPLATGVGANGY
jgi:hypothetical protein